MIMASQSSYPPYQLRGHIVAPRGIAAIREIAVDARQVLDLGDAPVSMPHFLDSLSLFGVTVDVIEDEDLMLMMAGVEAVCVPESATINLTPATYEAARRNDPRTRFTIFHELGHFVLQHSKALARHNYVAKPFIDSEWQADQFSAEMTMPLEVMLRLDLLTPTKVAQFFQTSLPAAITRVNQLRKFGAIK
ncbi:ImmA/IrrE family metallo-endopeptidase [Variovorax sp. 278MFTsu5.1]|uniref:ImmA/IrrE family metallo-endopeptidase n=1 Tax=Variovorax sp. 278MFTsu5.1 TaxID=3158366 RepID=UPI003AACC589